MQMPVWSQSSKSSVVLGQQATWVPEEYGSPPAGVHGDDGGGDGGDGGGGGGGGGNKKLKQRA